MINFKTYLTPSIPKDIFEILANYLENKCKVKVNLITEITSSGPKKGEPIIDDLVCMCSPPYYWLYEKYKDIIELLPWVPLYKDPRNINLPLYFSDILIHKDNNEIKSLKDLNNHNWAYNDTESLSGYFCISDYKDKINMICSGSHLNSIKMVSEKKVDITCIDSNVLPFINHDLKSIGYFGPHPIQPFILNKNSKYKTIIIDVFNSINDNIDVINQLNNYNIIKFIEINNEFFFGKYSIKNLIE